MNNFSFKDKPDYHILLRDLIINLEKNVKIINEKLDVYDTKFNESFSSTSSGDNFLNINLRINENKNKLNEHQTKLNLQEVELNKHNDLLSEHVNIINEQNEKLIKLQTSLDDYERKLSTLQLNNLPNDSYIQDLQNIKSKISLMETLEEKLQNQIDTLENRIEEEKNI